jgi:hypothetical protein
MARARARAQEQQGGALPAGALAEWVPPHSSNRTPLRTPLPISSSTTGANGTAITARPSSSSSPLHPPTPRHRPPTHPPPRSYLRLGSVLSGFADLMRRLMRVELRVEPAPAAEAWARGVLKLAASHPDLGELGTVYLDLVRQGILPFTRCIFGAREMGGPGQLASTSLA